jgi:hypothetical protein
MNPERMASDAPRAPAAGRGPVSGPLGGQGGVRFPLPPDRPLPIGGILLIALLSGALVGISLALLSIFAPGALPALSIG